jgi:type II secretory pathway component GspD/PulD (secretin)
VVDGLQRISSIKNFTIDKKLKLQNLEFLTQFNDYTYDDLPRDLQRRIEESEITVYVINPGTPNDVKYNIFKRINTGGLVLEPQEIRHALNQGTPARFIAELARMEEFKIATNYRIYPHRMMDREFVTRFVAFYINDYNDYKPDLDSFMNKSMADIKDLSEDERIDIKYNFRESMKLAKEIFTQWTFRKVYYTNERRKPINKALYEAWSVCLAKLSDNERDILRVHKDVLFSKFLSLMNSDTRFNDSITSSTSDKSRIVYRFTAIKNLIASTIN